ncbi:MAG: transporter substrate-binding domain-containing protein [Deltaproteobacteria bacterium]|nr:transporter substrate-binding domain-containing protein [Deltaproteobacteria bacterium]
MKKMIVLLLSSALAAVLATGARGEDTLEKVKRTGVLVAGLRDDAPPFGFKEMGSGTIVGYDEDYVAALAAKLGAKLEVRPVTRVTRLSALIDGNVDVVAANLIKSDSRRSVIALSDTYLTTGQRFLAKRGAIKTLKDLEGKKVGAIIGTPSEGCARDACQGGTLMPFDDYVQAIRALQTGAIDAFTADQAILIDLLPSLPKGDYEIPDLQISQEDYVLGARQGDERFLQFLNASIRDLQQSGEAKKIYDKWFGIREERPTTAYGAIIRKAATPPRFLAITLNGALFPKADVSVFALDGNYLGKGTVASVLGDEFYLDVDPALNDLLRPGFLVTMNMTNAMARDVVIRHQDLLKSVKADAEGEAEKLRAQSEQEGIAKQKRAQEIDMMEKQTEMQIDAERARYYLWRRNY